MTETCFSCGLTHRHVELRGVHHCPNPACTVSGAAWFRGGLPSTKNEKWSHCVDPDEWIEAVVAWITKAEEDQTIRDAAYTSLQRLRERYQGREE